MSVIASLYKNTSSERVFNFKSVLRNETSNPESLTLEGWMNLDEHITVGELATVTQSNQTYRKICFSLSGHAAAYYPLFRSIIASGPPHVHLITNKEVKGFVLKFVVGMEDEVSRYLAKVLDMIKAEIRFKQVLRKLIANQERFLLEERLLFNQLSE